MTERSERIAWFKATILPYEAALRNHLRRAGSLRNDVDDIVAEAMARAYAAHDWTRITRGKSYLFMIARNLIRDTARRNKIIEFETVADMEVLNVQDGEGSPEAMATARDELRLLQAAIDDLPPRCREVFLLRRIDGLSTSEVGGRLGLSVSTIENHMTKALAVLTEALAKADMVRLDIPGTPSWMEKRNL